MADPTVAHAILDRLVHNAYKIFLKGESMRKTIGTGMSNDLPVRVENPAALRHWSPAIGMAGRLAPEWVVDFSRNRWAVWPECASGLLAPARRLHARGPRAHDGTIKTTAPDRMWGTDATRFWTDKEGLCWFFVAVDHCVEDVVGWHVAKVGDRFAALEPVRQGVSSRLGPIAKDVACGLALRHDHGPQYLAREFQSEIAYVGITSSTDWRLGRLGYRSPLEARPDYRASEAA